MTLQDVKLVATDLDGTLLGSDHVVSARTAATLQAVAEAGVEVVAITGRSHWSAVPLLQHLGSVRWIICSNGASVFDMESGSVVEREELTAAEVEAVVEATVCKFPTIGFAWERLDGLFHSCQWATNRRATESHLYRARGSKLVDIPHPSDGPVLKLLLAHDVLRAYDWLYALGPHVPFGLSASTSGAAFVEVTSGEANKGSALARMCSRLGVKREATVAFGDNANDLAMLRWAGRGYAMANAHALAVDVADELAPHHADDGVAQVLEGLLGF